MTAAAKPRAARPNVQHSAKSCEHGSPAAAVELARYALGGLDLDPASNAYWNRHTVKAARFYDRAANGLAQPWAGRVWCNPPGADEEAGTDSLVRPYWERLVAHWREGLIDGAVWLGYSLEQLVLLQAAPAHPLMFVTVVPCERLRFLERRPGDAPPVERLGPDGKPSGPTHGNFITLLPSRRSDSEARAQVARFRERAAALTTRAGAIGGAIVRPL